MFKCIKNFFVKMWDEVKKMNSYDDPTHTTVWDYVEEEETSTQDAHETTNNEATEDVPPPVEEIVLDKRVAMMDLNGQIVNVYANIKSTIKEHPDYTYSGLYGCIRGRRQSYKGYIFRYMCDIDRTAN